MQKLKSWGIPIQNGNSILKNTSLEPNKKQTPYQFYAHKAGDYYRSASLWQSTA